MNDAASISQDLQVCNLEWQVAGCMTERVIALTDRQARCGQQCGARRHDNAAVKACERFEPGGRHAFSWHQVPTKSRYQFSGAGLK